MELFWISLIVLPQFIHVQLNLYFDSEKILKMPTELMKSTEQLGKRWSEKSFTVWGKVN